VHHLLVDFVQQGGQGGGLAAAAGANDQAGPLLDDLGENRRGLELVQGGRSIKSQSALSN